MAIISNPTGKFAIILVAVAIALLGIVLFVNTPSFQERRGMKRPVAPEKTFSTMEITSPAFKQNEFIPAKYTCEGENVNPELRISGVPEAAKSLALIVDDPDAPRGAFTHWLAWNIDPKTSIIPENANVAEAIAAPTGVGASLARQIVGREGENGAGKTGYLGPCPPSGAHRYFFKLYALDAMLAIPATAHKTELEEEIQKHHLAEAELVGLYQRK